MYYAEAAELVGVIQAGLSDCRSPAVLRQVGRNTHRSAQRDSTWEPPHLEAGPCNVELRSRWQQNTLFT